MFLILLSTIFSGKEGSVNGMYTFSPSLGIGIDAYFRDLDTNW